MHKRFVTALLITLLSLVCALGFTATACGGTADEEQPAVASVAGKTYSFYDASYTSETELPDERKELIEQQIERIKSGNAEAKFIFGADGTVVLSFSESGTSVPSETYEGAYEQNGEDLTIIIDGIPQVFKLSGEELYATVVEDVVTINQIYKLVTE